jgi:hypothetical protein
MCPCHTVGRKMSDKNLEQRIDIKFFMKMVKVLVKHKPYLTSRKSAMTKVSVYE